MNKDNVDNNRRNSKRCTIKHTTVVYNDDFFGQLIDISKGGLAFAYPKNQTKLKDMFFCLNLYCKNKDIHIKNLQCKIISETPFPQHFAESEEQIQRQGIEFGKLSEDQQNLLNLFIQHTENVNKNITPPTYQ